MGRVEAAATRPRGRGSSGTLSPWEEEEGKLKLHSTQKTTPGKSNFNININNHMDLGRPKGEITEEKTVESAYIHLKTSLGQRAPRGTAAPGSLGTGLRGAARWGCCPQSVCVSARACAFPCLMSIAGPRRKRGAHVLKHGQATEMAAAQNKH